jgi:WD40 repeat protein
VAAKPSKLVAVPSAILAKYDRASYGGGVAGGQLVADDAVVLGFQNSSLLVSLAKQTAVNVWAGGLGVAYDPGSRRTLLAQYGALALIDPAGKIVARWSSSIVNAPSARFAPDGSIAAACSTGGVVELWDTKTMKGIPKAKTDALVRTFIDGGPSEGPPCPPVRGTAGFPSEPCLPRTFDLPEGKPLASLGGHGTSFVFSLAFSPDGGLLATGNADGKVCVHAALRRRLLDAHTFRGDAVAGLDFAPDGEHLLVGLQSGRVLVLDRRGKPLGGWKTKDAIYDLRVVGSGAVATVGQKSLAVWDRTSGKLLATIARKPSSMRAKILDARGGLLLLRGPAALVRVG